MLRLWILTLALVLMAGRAAAGSERPEIVWLNLNLPPAFIAQGPMAGEGYVEKTHAYFASRLTGYRHSAIRVSVLRAESLLDSRDGACTLGLLASRRRLEQLPFSDPVIPVVPNRMIVWAADRARFMPYLDADGQISLDAMDRATGLVIGYSLGRFYTEPISQFLAARREKPDAAREMIMIEDDRIAFLLAHRRIDVAFGYPEEVGYQTRHGAADYLDTDAFASFAVKGTSRDVAGGVACSNSPLGRRIVEDVNRLIDEPGVRETLAGYYAEWLDPDARRDLEAVVKERREKGVPPNRP